MKADDRRRLPSVERKRLWLQALFGSALVAAAAPAMMLQGCGDPQSTGATSAGGSSSTGATHDDAGNPDHQGQGGGGGSEDAGSDARDASADGDACLLGPVVTLLDATVPDSGPDADHYCRLDIPCGLSDVFAVVGCDLMFESPDGAITGSAYGCTLITDGGCDAAVLTSNVSLLCGCDAINGGGRRPFGGRTARRVRAGDPLAVYLARMAHAEAASVVAFEELAAALEHLGAPDELIVASRASAQDERRHAAVMTRLARRRGAEPPPVTRRTHRAPRPLDSIARENAIEGCIRETFGALVATWQARRAEDPALRRAFASIASDETRHAALSWAIASWADQALDPRGRAEVARARRAALRRLARELAIEPDPALAKAAGLPARSEARALLRTFASSPGVG